MNENQQILYSGVQAALKASWSNGDMGDFEAYMVIAKAVLDLLFELQDEALHSTGTAPSAAPGS